MLVTVFTPTYNRKELLFRAYESLIRQDFRDFEWLIVDDGSTDDTETEVNKWIEEGKITIRYYAQENGGKMRAHNKGVNLAKGELFVCLDSDDYFTDDALSLMVNAYRLATSRENVNGLKENREIGGVVSHKGKSANEIFMGKDFAKVSLSTLYGLYLNGFKGETTLMYRTDILRQFPFPEFEGEKYVPEDYIYDKIDKVCVLAVLERITTICEIVDSGYTDSVKRLRQNNPKAWQLYFEQRAIITPPGLLKLKYLGRYVLYTRRCNKNPFDNKEIGFINVLAGYLWGAVLLLMKKE